MVEPTTPSEPFIELTTPSDPVNEPTTPSDPVNEPTTPADPEMRTQHARPQVTTILRYRVMEDLHACCP